MIFPSTSSRTSIFASIITAHSHRFNSFNIFLAHRLLSSTDNLMHLSQEENQTTSRRMLSFIISRLIPNLFVEPSTEIYPWFTKGKVLNLSSQLKTIEGNSERQKIKEEIQTPMISRNNWSNLTIQLVSYLQSRENQPRNHLILETVSVLSIPPRCFRDEWGPVLHLDKFMESFHEICVALVFKGKRAFGSIGSSYKSTL